MLKDGEAVNSIGVGASGEVSFTAVSGKAKSALGILQSEIEGSAGKVAVSGKTQAVLWKNGNFDPSVEASVKAQAEGLSVKQSIQAGAEKFNYHGSGEATLGYAEAKAGVKLGSDGISAEAKAGAYAAKGKVTSGFTIFGIKIDVEAEGKLGGASIGVGADISDREISLGGELGLIAGLGLKIKIGW